MKEQPFEKVLECKICKRKFTAEAVYDYNETGDDIFEGYTDTCDFCRHRINPKLVHICQLYKDGLLTNADLINRLKEL